MFFNENITILNNFITIFKNVLDGCVYFWLILSFFYKCAKEIVRNYEIVRDGFQYDNFSIGKQKFNYGVTAITEL